MFRLQYYRHDECKCTNVHRSLHVQDIYFSYVQSFKHYEVVGGVVWSGGEVLGSEIGGRVVWSGW